VIEQMAVAVIVTDLAGTIIGWNRQAALLYGWPAEEAMGRQIMDVLVDDNDRDRAEDILGGVRLGETWGGEFPVRRKDGARVVAFVTNSPLLDADGSPIGVIGVSVGITERRQAEQDRSELLAREREARTRAEEANSELQILQEVIEIALAHVAVDDLVLALLTRIRDTLNVDTATLLLFNDEQTHLVVRATLGREGEEVEALRIPRGEGLAGRIAQGGAPLVVDDLTQVEVHSDFLRKNIRSLLGVPLFVAAIIGAVAGFILRAPRHHAWTVDPRLPSLIYVRTTPTELNDTGSSGGVFGSVSERCHRPTSIHWPFLNVISR
jgi:PAS domain S-box-containing protein